MVLRLIKTKAPRRMSWEQEHTENQLAAQPGLAVTPADFRCEPQHRVLIFSLYFLLRQGLTMWA